MTARVDCAAKGYTKNGVRYDGHSYVALLAFQDRETERWYYVDKCEHCGHSNVCFSEDGVGAEYYPEIAKVGDA